MIQTQRLGYALIAASRLAPPRARSVWLISNAADLAVSNAAGRKIVANWRAVGATNVHEFQFPGSWKLFHDLIDPLQPNAQPDRVHPILESLIADGRAPDPSTLRTQARRLRAGEPRCFEQLLSLYKARTCGEANVGDS